MFLKLSGGQLPSHWLWYLLAKLVSVTWKEELQMPGISTIVINKTLFVFANF